MYNYRKNYDYKTNVTQNHQKIELYGNLTTKDLKNPHSSRQIGREEMQRSMERWHGDTEGAVPRPRVLDKNWKGYPRSERSQPQTRPPSLGFQCQEDKSP